MNFKATQSLTSLHPRYANEDDLGMVKRLEELESLPDNEKQQVFHYMDLIIRDYKTKKTYAK